MTIGYSLVVAPLSRVELGQRSAAKR
jgi:hypothetical protein